LLQAQGLRHSTVLSKGCQKAFDKLSTGLSKTCFQLCFFCPAGPMMMGKAALPYGGGHVVNLFSHKKYDSLTIEYLDSNRSFHGAIFRLAKGQGEAFKNTLIAHGAQISRSEDLAPAQNALWKPWKDRNGVCR
jgi:hypothetical protein